jgi:hypothetical protein
MPDATTMCNAAHVLSLTIFKNFPFFRKITRVLLKKIRSRAIFRETGKIAPVNAAQDPAGRRSSAWHLVSPLRQPKPAQRVSVRISGASGQSGAESPLAALCIPIATAKHAS